jgi:hypothetical protein
MIAESLLRSPCAIVAISRCNCCAIILQSLRNRRYHYATAAPSLHHRCAIAAPSMRNRCAIAAPSMRNRCVIAATLLRNRCTIAANCCAIAASSLRNRCMQRWQQPTQQWLSDHLTIVQRLHSDGKAIAQRLHSDYYAAIIAAQSLHICCAIIG